MAGEVRLTFDRDGRSVYVPVHVPRQLKARQPLDDDEVDTGSWLELFEPLSGDEEEIETIVASVEIATTLASTAVERGSRECDGCRGSSPTVSNLSIPPLIVAPVELCSRLGTSRSDNLASDVSAISAAASMAASCMEVDWSDASPWSVSEFEWWKVLSGKPEEKVELGSLLSPAAPQSKHSPMMVELGSLSELDPVKGEHGSQLEVVPVMVELRSLPAMVMCYFYDGVGRNSPLWPVTDGGTDGSLVVPRFELRSHGEPVFPHPHQASRAPAASRSPPAGWTEDLGCGGRLSSDHSFVRGRERNGALPRCCGAPRAGKERRAVASSLVRALTDCDQTLVAGLSPYMADKRRRTGARASYKVDSSEVDASAQHWCKVAMATIEGADEVTALVEVVVSRAVCRDMVVGSCAAGTTENSVVQQLIGYGIELGLGCLGRGLHGAGRIEFFMTQQSFALGPRFLVDPLPLGEVGQPWDNIHGTVVSKDGGLGVSTLDTMGLFRFEVGPELVMGHLDGPQFLGPVKTPMAMSGGPLAEEATAQGEV